MIRGKSQVCTGGYWMKRAPNECTARKREKGEGRRGTHGLISTGRDDKQRAH